jgi:diacylglycerol kinase family enzyme
MRRRFLLIDNAIAGYGSRDLVVRVVARLEREGAGIARCAGATVDGTLELVAKAARGGTYDAVVAAGGDGTIRLAARALAGTDMPLGVIPLGTGNVLAHEIGLERTPEAVADVLVQGKIVPIWAPTANGELFLLMAGAGFDGRVIETLSHPIKGRIGKLAYAGPLAGALMQPMDALEVTVDGTMHRASWAVIANARHYGGSFVIAEGASIHEPELKAVLFKGTKRSALLSSLVALATGRLATCPHVAFVSCTRAEIRSRTAIPVQVDGDAFGGTPLVVEANGQRVNLIMPAAASAR